jgi:predicted nucleic acid-binding protein
VATILLDTSVIVDHLNGLKGRSEFLVSLVEQGNILGCCSVSITEVSAGLHEAEEAQTKAFFESLQYFPVTAEIAEEAGRLRRDWRRKGQVLPITDVTIAAVAIAYRLPLLTDDWKRFPMPELSRVPLPETTE